MERPPYRPIQMDLLPEPTVPTFAKVINKPKSPALKPGEQWMRGTPPFMSDAEADETYGAACAWLFGTEEPTRGPAYPRDPRHPLHPQHLETLGIRERISRALAHQEYIKDFPRKYIPSLAQSSTSHHKMSAILKERDRVESALEVLFSDINPNGSSRDANRDIDAESVPLMKEVNDLNRALHNAYVDFLRPLQHTSNMGARPATTMRSVEPSRDPSVMTGTPPYASQARPRNAAYLQLCEVG
jgi:hypothetical protein